MKNRIKEQFFIDSLSYHYNLRQPKSSKPTMVFLVLYIYGRQYKISTGLKVYSKYWSKSRAIESPKLSLVDNTNNKVLNEKLDLYNRRFIEYKYLVSTGQINFGYKEIKQYITTGEILKEEIEHIDICAILLDYLYEDKSLKQGTKNNYIRFIKKFNLYLSTLSIHTYSDLTQEVIKGFQRWCITNIEANSTSINKIVSCTLKCIKKYLVGNGLISGSKFNDMQIVSLQETFIDDEIALRDDELTILYNYPCGSKRDEEIRDLFLLECTTGQRFSDIDKIDDLIEYKDGRTYINLVQDKTGEKIQVDIIFKMTLDILAKYNNHLPTYNKKIFNKRIKEIARLAGIEGKEEIRKEIAGKAGISIELKDRYNCVSSHTGRRTFVTLLSLRGKTYEEIQRYSGHSTLVMVQRYDKSKKGTKVKTMYERLKSQRPELLLELIE